MGILGCLVTLITFLQFGIVPAIGIGIVFFILDMPVRG